MPTHLHTLNHACKDRACAQATEALKITAPDLVKAGVMDEIIREPLGGAHADPMAAFPYIKDAILKIWHNKCAALPDAVGW